MTSIRSIRKRGQRRIADQFIRRSFNRVYEAFDACLQAFGKAFTQAFVGMVEAFRVARWARLIQCCKPDGTMSAPITGDGSGQRLPEIPQ